MTVALYAVGAYYRIVDGKPVVTIDHHLKCGNFELKN